MRLIIAPHADDELIGCYTVLSSLSQDRDIHVYCPEGGLKGCRRVSEYPERDLSCVWAPDPIHEYHPDHRQWGMFAEKRWRLGQIGSVHSGPAVGDCSEQEERSQYVVPG